MAMRLVTFRNRGATEGTRIGVQREASVVDVAKLAVGGSAPELRDMLALIDAGAPALRRLETLITSAPADALLPLDAVELLAPIPRPRKNIFCVGRNYAEHAAESLRAIGQEVTVTETPNIFTKAVTTVAGPYADIPLDPGISDQLDWEVELGVLIGQEVTVTETPNIFTKAVTTVAGPYADIPLDPGISDQLDWEVELGVVIGQAGRHIRKEDALAHVFGYTVVNDISARDIQHRTGLQWFLGKSLDGTCPMGPCLVTADELPDPQALRLHLEVNGVTKQDSTTDQMLFDVAAIIAALSEVLTLEQGDIIATGTPSGVGFGRTPKEFLRPGDLMESTIEGIGTLRNRIVLVER